MGADQGGVIGLQGLHLRQNIQAVPPVGIFWLGNVAADRVKVLTNDYPWGQNYDGSQMMT